jgi:ribosome maturation factor RimP
VRTAKIQQIIEALEPAAERNGFELIDVELGGTAHNPVLRVYLDKQGELLLDDIAAANAWLSAEIDALEPFRGSYTLEASSPGIDRPLRTLEHFTRFAGEEVKIVTAPQEQHKNRSNWTGILKGVQDGKVCIELDGSLHHLTFSEIKKAHVKGKIDFSKESARGNNNAHSSSNNNNA